MKDSSGSRITLTARDLKLVVALQKKLRARSRVEVVTRGLQMLRDATERVELRDGYRKASRATRKSLAAELVELDTLSVEGLIDS